MKKIKLLIFDLDGVLIKTKELHYISLNRALEEVAPEFKITLKEHISIFDGLPTKKKLSILEKRGLNSKLFEEINKRKQKYTFEYLQQTIKRNDALYKIISTLSDEGYKIYVASNAIRKTVISCLHRLGIIEYIDYILSNEDVKFGKPNPEIYLRCILHAGLLPEETVIFEDSYTGRMAALKSGANLVPIDTPEDITYDFIKHKISVLEGSVKKDKWVAKDTIVLIPMAGAGSRFEKMGYTFPKPLIDVNGKPMIQVIVENLNIEAEFIYIVQKSHFEKYNLSYLLNLLTPNCKIVQVDGITEGAACTTLLAKEYIDKEDKHLVTVNSDQVIEWDSHDFFYTALNRNCDGAILTFKATHPKWSFAKVEDGLVVEVAEKKPISDRATVGIYYWNKASDYIKYAEQMINKNIRVNNEFYICPVYNEAIQDGKRIIEYNVDKMWGIGTPEDLNYYLENYHGN